MRPDRIVTLVLMTLAVVACGSESVEARLALASDVPTDADCRDETLGPVSLRVDPAEPGGALIVVDPQGAVLDLTWDPRFRVRVEGEDVAIEAPDGRALSSPMTLVGSRLPGGRFLVCDLRAGASVPESHGVSLNRPRAGLGGR